LTDDRRPVSSNFIESPVAVAWREASGGGGPPGGGGGARKRVYAERTVARGGAGLRSKA